MLTISQNVLIVLFALAISVGLWYVIGRYWPQERRRTHNEITGWQISVLGTTYAVIVGFMLFAAWSDFKVAEQNADGESGCVINLYWSASGLPQVQRDDIRNLAVDYAEAMINVEWPAMREGALSPAGTLIIEKLWLVVARPESLSASEQVSLEQATSEISSITEHRRIRQLQSQSALPAILWAVLVIGAVITIISSCLFGSEYPVLHLLQVLALSLMLSMALVTVADVNHPFQGSVHVNPIGFENARRTFAKYGGQ